MVTDLRVDGAVPSIPMISSFLSNARYTYAVLPCGSIATPVAGPSKLHVASGADVGSALLVSNAIIMPDPSPTMNNRDRFGSWAAARTVPSRPMSLSSRNVMRWRVAPGLMR